MSNVTRTLAEFSRVTTIQQIPAGLLHQVKLVILDLVGCALAGIAVDKGRISARYARDLGGTAESTIIGDRAKVSSTNAALANGELMNALDWDPIPHTLPCTIGAILAAGEREGATGEDLLLAAVIAYEISERLVDVLPADLDARPHGYGSCIFGGVAGAGRILKLNDKQMRNAFGIAGFAAPVPAMRRFEGEMSTIPMTKYISAGFVAQSALTSALLAKLDYTGDTAILDGPQAFWRFFGGDEERWDADRLTKDLGKNWHARKPWHKPYPCEIIIGFAVNRLREIMAQNGIVVDDIDAIDVLSIPFLTSPCHTTTDISTHVDAQFSVPYAMALAANGVEVGPVWQEPRMINDPQMRRFMGKVRVGLHPELSEWVGPREADFSFGRIPCLLRVSANGRAFTIDRPEEPAMTEQDLLGKFASCATAVLPRSQAERAQALILELEHVENVAALMDCLSPEAG